MNAGPFKAVLAGQALIEHPVEVATAAARRLAAEIFTADIAITNFEGTLGSPHAWPVKMKTLHIATAEAMASLRSLGFNALGLANNHAFDLGQPGLEATRAGALAAGFVAAGSGENRASAAAPAWVSAAGQRAALLVFDLGPQADMVYAGEKRPGINPLRIRKQLVLPPADVARFSAIARACGQEERMARRVKVGYSEAAPEGSADFFGLEICAGTEVAERYYVDPDDLAHALAAVRKTRETGGPLFVSMHNHHWSPDWALAPAWLQSLCAALVEAGADAVLCHGPPVLQGMSFHRGRPVFYGMGNLVFHTARAGRYDENGIDVWRSIIASCEFAADGRMGLLRVHPIRVGMPADKHPGMNVLQAPELLEGKEAAEVLDRFTSLSMLAGTTVSIAGDTCTIRPAA